MHSGLNIQLEQQPTTRRDYRRVVALCGAIGAGIIFAILFFRLQFAFDSTLGLRPQNTFVSANIIKSAGNVRLLNEHLGNYAVLPGLPLTLTDFIALTNDSLSVHLAEEGATAVTVDKILDANTSAKLAIFGYKATQNGEATIISQENTTIENVGKTFMVRSLLPLSDGELRLIETKTTSYPIKISKKGIRLAGIGIAAENTSTPLAPSDTVVLGQIAIPGENYLAIPQVFESIVPIKATFSAFNTLAQQGGNLLLTEDQQGIGYFLSFPPGDMSVEELANLGKDIINRQSLTTQAWTTADGEDYLEIRSELDKIITDISAENSFTLITLTNSQQDTVRLARTDSLLTLSNRQISLENTERSRSECLYNAHTWFTTDLITQFDTASLNTNTAITKFLVNFDEIAINSRKTQLCW